MNLNLIKLSFAALAAGSIFCGCSQVESSPIGGGYFLESTRQFSLLSEPGGVKLRIVHMEAGKRTIVTTTPSGGTTTNNNFSWRVYGNNLVFVEHEPAKPWQHKLALFSRSKGLVTLDTHWDDYWKINATDEGLVCHRLQDGIEKDDPSPVLFPASRLVNP